MTSPKHLSDAPLEPDEAFSELYRLWQPALVRLCHHYLRGRLDAEAVAQEAFLRAWRSWDSYALGRPFWPWVAAIARNLCINHGTVAAHRGELHRIDSDELANRRVPSAWLQDDDEIDTLVDRLVVRDTLRRLSPRHQRLLRMRDVEGFSYEEIARFDGITVEAVRGSLRRARQHFRDVYERTRPRAWSGVVYGVLLRVRRGSARLTRVLEAAGAPLGRSSAPELLAAVAALLLGTVAVDARAEPRVPAPVERVAAPAADAVLPRVPAPPATVSTGTSLPSAPAPAATSGGEGPGSVSEAMDGQITNVTVSPSYEQDHTVFASGTTRSDCATTWGCPVLYRSQDGGATWRRLPAEGRSDGHILLPPAYPADRRIFSVGRALLAPDSGLEVSTDGGRTFSLVTTLTGPVAMSPGFSAGDPRILVGAVLPPPAKQLGLEYVDGEGVRPLSLDLPLGANPATFTFSPRYVDDRRILVGAMESDVLLSSPTSRIYECVGASPCRRLVDFDVVQGAPRVVPAGSGDERLLAWLPFNLYRSDDGGTTFRELERPGIGRNRSIADLYASADGRLFASVVEDGLTVGRTWVSSDEGATWQEFGAGAFDAAFAAMAVLPDGRMIAARLGEVGVTCSTDGGRSWATSCAG